MKDETILAHITEDPDHVRLTNVIRHLSDEGTEGQITITFKECDDDRVSVLEMIRFLTKRLNVNGLPMCHPIDKDKLVQSMYDETIVKMRNALIGEEFCFVWNLKNGKLHMFKIACVASIDEKLNNVFKLTSIIWSKMPIEKGYPFARYGNDVLANFHKPQRSSTLDIFNHIRMQRDAGTEIGSRYDIMIMVDTKKMYTIIDYIWEHRSQVMWSRNIKIGDITKMKTNLRHGCIVLSVDCGMVTDICTEQRFPVTLGDNTVEIKYTDRLFGVKGCDW